MLSVSPIIERYLELVDDMQQLLFMKNILSH